MASPLRTGNTSFPKCRFVSDKRPKEPLIAELKRTLAYSKLRKRIAPEKAATFVNWVRDHGTVAEDPASPPPVGSRDPDDDYLLALAINRRAYLVTGDKDLLILSDNLPILTPAQFATKLRETS